MIKYFLFISTSLFLLPFAFGTVPIRDQVQELLPKELSSLSETDTRKQLEEKFAKTIKKKEGTDTLYLNYFEDKNDVTIGTKKGVFDYLYVEIPKDISDKKSGFYDSILSQLTEAQKKEIAAKNRRNTSHEAGRYILIDLPSEGLKLEFLNNEKKDLRSIIITPKIKK
jgi:hypothetical protein